MNAPELDQESLVTRAVAVRSERVQRFLGESEKDAGSVVDVKCGDSRKYPFPLVVEDVNTDLERTFLG